MRIPVYQQQVGTKFVPTAKPSIDDSVGAAVGSGVQEFGSLVERIAVEAAGKLKKARIDDQILDARLKTETARNAKIFSLRMDPDYGSHEKQILDLDAELMPELDKGLTEPEAKRAFFEWYKLSGEQLRSNVRMGAYELEADHLGSKLEGRLDVHSQNGDHLKIDSEIFVSVANGVINQATGVQLQKKYHHSAEYNMQSAKSIDILMNTGDKVLARKYIYQHPNEYLTPHDRTALVQDVEQMYDKQKAEARSEQMKGAFDMIIDGKYDELEQMIQPDVGQVKPGGTLWALDVSDMENLYGYIQSQRKGSKPKDDYVDQEWEQTYTKMYLDSAHYDQASLVETIQRGHRDGKVSSEKARSFIGDVESKRKDDMNDAGVMAIKDWYDRKTKGTTDEKLILQYGMALAQTLKTYKSISADPKMSASAKRDAAIGLTSEVEKSGWFSSVMTNIFGVEKKAEKPADIKVLEENIAAFGGDVEGLTRAEAQHKYNLRTDPSYQEFVRERNAPVGFTKENPQTGERIYSATMAINDWWMKSGKTWKWYDPTKKTWVEIDKKQRKEMWKK